MFSDVRIDFPGDENGFCPDVVMLRESAKKDDEGHWRYQDVEFVAEVISRGGTAQNDYGPQEDRLRGRRGGPLYLVADPYQGRCFVHTDPKDGDYETRTPVDFGTDIDLTGTVIDLVLKTDEFPPATDRRWLLPGVHSTSLAWGTMKYTQLGRTGLKVSRLVLGTMNFGPQTDEADSHAIMDAALDAGINFFDTANVYGWGGENKGRTESIIGNWFAKGGDRRDKVSWRPRCTATWARTAPRLAQPRQALRPEHPAGRRRQPEAAADRPHRPLPVPPHRPGHPRSRRSGRPWTSWSSRARSSTSARPTSPATRSPRPTRSPPGAAAPSAW